VLLVSFIFTDGFALGYWIVPPNPPNAGMQSEPPLESSFSLIVA
jgi:hypothetical protein